MENPVKKPVRSSPYEIHRGIAAENIEPNSDTLYVICPGLTPNASFGSLGAGITENSISLQDRDGKPIVSKSTTANHIVATWEGSTNSRTPPEVRKGEPVEVFRTSGQDKYYWRAVGAGRDFRSTDAIIAEVGATDPNKPGVEKNDTNTYTAFLDSKNKRVGFKTSMANGEVAAFSMEADLAKGTLFISDNGKDPGTRIYLDTGALSGTPIFQVNLPTGVALKFEGENAFINVPDSLQINVGKRFIVNSPLSVFNIAEKGTVIINAMNVAINSGKDFVVTAGRVIGLNAVSTKVSGVLLAALLRAAVAVKLPVEGKYKPAYVQRPEETPVKEADNSTDTLMTGPKYLAS